MKLSEFLRDHYDHYVYLHKDDGTVITDVMVKFVPYWVLVMYGECEVRAECRESGSTDAYCIYDVTVFVEARKYLKDVLDECISAEHVGCNVKIQDALSSGDIQCAIKLCFSADDDCQEFMKMREDSLKKDHEDVQKDDQEDDSND